MCERPSGSWTYYAIGRERMTVGTDMPVLKILERDLRGRTESLIGKFARFDAVAVFDELLVQCADRVSFHSQL